MLIKSFFSVPFRFWVIVLFLLLAGCASPVMKMPKPMPDLVKEYKSYFVGGGSPGMSNTGVQVKKGEFVSVIAKGTIHLGRLGSGSAPERLLIRIGEKGFSGRYLGSARASFVAFETGNIYLGYLRGPTDAYGEPLNPGSYRNDTGGYNVDIIVWEKNDPVRIADFLAEVSLSDPSNEVLKDFAQTFKSRKNLILAEQKAKKEVEETEKAILALKGKEIPDLQVGAGKGVSELNEKKLQEEADLAIQAAKEKGAIGIKDSQKEKTDRRAERTDFKRLPRL